MSRTVIINEDIYNQIQEGLEITQYKFKSNLKKFLAELLEDPIGAQPSVLFTGNGIDKNTLIKTLIDNKVINKVLKIDDHDSEGNPHTAKMIVKYSVPKHRFNDRLDVLYGILFPNVEGVINEDGGGATNCSGVSASGNGSCGFIQPLSMVQRKEIYNTKPNKKKKKNEPKIYEAVTGEDVRECVATYVYCKDEKGNLYILCGKRIKYPGDKMGGKYNPPMGHLHKGESKEDGAVRECFEESGIKLDKSLLKLESKERWGWNFSVLLPSTIDKYEPKKGDEENHKFKWLKIENIPTLDWAWSCGKFAHKYIKSVSLNEAREERMSLLLLEALTPDEIYNKYYSTIDRNIFDAAIAADPTSYNQQGEIYKVGGYVKWILKLYQNGSWKTGDSVETKDLLNKFNKLKTRLPVEQRDINSYSSVSELYNTLKPYLNIQSRSEIKQEAEKVYEDNDWLIIIPHTEEAACHYGANTKWCTAAKEDNMFDYYNEKGPLYINIHKPTNRKYQFQFESRQFMNEEDNPIQPNELPWTEGVLDYYKSINKEIYFKFDEVYDIDDNGIAVVILNNKETWFSVEKQDYLFPNKWFDWVSYFSNNGIAIVELNDKRTWFSVEKQDYLFPNQWFYDVGDFDSNGIAKVELNDKWTWFSLEKQGLLFPNQWFDKVDDFDSNGIAVVKLNDKWTWFSLEKQDYLFSNKWFDWVGYFNNGIAIVKLNGKYNWFSLEKQGLLAPNQWFDTVDDFNNGIAIVELNGEKYYFTLDGQLLDYNTKQQLSQEQQIAEMVNKLVKKYLI